MSDTRSPMARRLAREERGLYALGFFLKAVVAFAILVVVANEIGQVAIAQVHAHNAARAAAQAGANAYYLTKNINRAEAEALAAAQEVEPNAQILSFGVDRITGVATASAEDTATTLVVGRVGFLKHLGIQRATERETHTT